MNNIFSMDNAFFRFVGKVTDLIWLNILTLLCCLPLITAGAAISAMYAVLIKRALNEEGTITKPFFKAFKDNFRNSTKVWVPALIILIILLSNMYLIFQGVLDPYGNLYIIAGVSIGIIGTAVLMFLNYALPLFARYDRDVKQTMKNALLMMLAYFPRSLCMIIIWLFPLALMMLSNVFLLFWFIYGLSFPGYFNAMLLGNIFIKTEEATEHE